MVLLRSRSGDAGTVAGADGEAAPAGAAGAQGRPLPATTQRRGAHVPGGGVDRGLKSSRKVPVAGAAEWVLGGLDRQELREQPLRPL